MIPFIIDNHVCRLVDVLRELLTQSVGEPLDIATDYFGKSGYRLESRYNSREGESP